MMRFDRVLWVVMALVVMAACSTSRERIELSQELHAGDHIGVLPINFQEKPEARVYTNPVKLAGTVGRIAVAKAEDATRRKFTDALEEIDYSYQDNLTNRLIAALGEAGYEAEVMDFRRSINNVLEAVPPGQFEKRYPKDTDYDYLLDIYVDYFGYAAPRLGDSYKPTAHIAVRLVDADTLATAYQSEIHYHPIDPAPGVHAIAVGDAYEFAEFQDIIGDIDRARDGLQQAVDALIREAVAEISQ